MQKGTTLYPGLVGRKFDALRQISGGTENPNVVRAVSDAAKGHALRDQFTTDTQSNCYEIQHAVRDKLIPTIVHAARGESWVPGKLHPNLSWTHYWTLLRVDKPAARAFYEIKALEGGAA